MTALSSGRHFISGVAVYLGAPLSVRSVLQAHTSQKPRRRVARHMRTPLSDRQKKELLESIRSDDWLE